ncbi:hypothetical protein BH24GEM3_BH24GEM3_24720 [soil metagenome]
MRASAAIAHPLGVAPQDGGRSTAGIIENDSLRKIPSDKLSKAIKIHEHSSFSRLRLPKRPNATGKNVSTALATDLPLGRKHGAPSVHFTPRQSEPQGYSLMPRRPVSVPPTYPSVVIVIGGSVVPHKSLCNLGVGAFQPKITPHHAGSAAPLGRAPDRPAGFALPESGLVATLVSAFLRWRIRFFGVVILRFSRIYQLHTDFARRSPRRAVASASARKSKTSGGAAPGCDFTIAWTIRFRRPLQSSTAL